MDQLATNATDGKPKNLLFNDDSGADETLVPAPNVARRRLASAGTLAFGAAVDLDWLEDRSMTMQEES